MRFAAPFLLLLLGCAHPSGASQTTDDSGALVGMWRLVEVVGVRDDGTTTTSKWGPHPTGYIVYDRAGLMTVQIMGDPRPVFHDAKHPTPEEGLAAFESYLAYA